jgi:hypothetical protein
MKQIAILFFTCAAAAVAQTGRISGTVIDDSGAPVVGAMVMASLRSSPAPVTPTPGQLPPFMPVMANAASGSKGDFEIKNLLVGTYALCVEASQGAYLNPCVWADQPVTVEMADGAVVKGVPVVAPRGVVITVRVRDLAGLLAADPAGDDLRIGTYNGRLPFIPARVSARDANGRTMSLVVPGGQSRTVAVSSGNFALADDKGTALASAETKISVNAPAIGSLPAGVGAATPTVIVQVTGKKAGR